MDRTVAASPQYKPPNPSANALAFASAPDPEHLAQVLGLKQNGPLIQRVLIAAEGECNFEEGEVEEGFEDRVRQGPADVVDAIQLMSRHLVNGNRDIHPMGVRALLDRFAFDHITEFISVWRIAVKTRLGTIYNRIGTESTSENATPCWSRYFRLHDQALDTVDDLFMAIARFGLSDQYLQKNFSKIAARHREAEASIFFHSHAAEALTGALISLCLGSETFPFNFVGSFSYPGARQLYLRVQDIDKVIWNMPPFSRRGLGLEIGYCKLLLQILVGEHVGTSDTWRVPYVTCQFEDCGKKDGLSRCGKCLNVKYC